MLALHRDGLGELGVQRLVTTATHGAILPMQRITFSCDGQEHQYLHTLRTYGSGVRPSSQMHGFRLPVEGHAVASWSPSCGQFDCAIKTTSLFSFARLATSGPAQYSSTPRQTDLGSLPPPAASKPTTGLSKACSCSRPFRLRRLELNLTPVQALNPISPAFLGPRPWAGPMPPTIT